MSDNQWVVDVADIDEKNCVIRIWNMHCPECGYDPIAETVPGCYMDALNVPKTCPQCGKVLGTYNEEKKKKTFLVEMNSVPVMGTNGGSCTCPVCLSGPHPMCLIAGAQVENLDHCPVLKEVTNG